MSLWVLMGRNGSFCVDMESNGFLWVLMRPYGSLWVLIGPDAWLWILKGSYVSVFSPDSTLCILMGLNGSL